MKQRVVRASCASCLVIGLIGSLVAQAFYESVWHLANPNGIVTEEDMGALGDYPNVFAGWALLGWIPVLVGLILERSDESESTRSTIGSPGVVSSRVPHHPAYGSVQGGSNQLGAFAP